MLPQLMVLDDLVPTPLVETAYEVFRDLVMPPSLFYVSIDALRAETAAASLADYLPEPVAAYVARHLNLIMRACPDSVVAAAEGFEFWLRVNARAGDKAFLHVDNDETLRRRTGEIRCPLIGTIFHLGPVSGLTGGETLFDLVVPDVDDHECRFALASWDALRARCAAPILIPQRGGRLILFKGDLPHAVAPIRHCDPDTPRVALLANLWDRRISSVPTGIAALSPEAFQTLRRDDNDRTSTVDRTL